MKSEKMGGWWQCMPGLVEIPAEVFRMGTKKPQSVTRCGFVITAAERLSNV